MIVYIVTSGCYSDYGIEAVFESKEKAEVYCALHPNEDQEIEEWETRDDNFQCDKPVFSKWIGKIQEDGVVTIINGGYSFKNVSVMKRIPQQYYHKPHTRIEFVTSTDKTQEQAKKIMFDKLAALKYEEEMGLEFK